MLNANAGESTSLPIYMNSFLAPCDQDAYTSGHLTTLCCGEPQAPLESDHDRKYAEAASDWNSMLAISLTL